MTNTPHRIHLSGFILAIAAVTLSVFPGFLTGVGPASSQKPPNLGEETTPVSIRTGEAIRRSLPLSFETNRGQAEADVEFVGRANGFGLLLKPNQAVFSLRKTKPMPARRSVLNEMQLNDESAQPHLLTMELEGANPTPLISGKEPREVRANYFIGNDPAKWIRGVETYSRVLYSGVYEGVDLVFYGNDRQLEYDFTVAPGADPKEIRLRFLGADNQELSPEGSLILHTPAGAVRHRHPVAYQEDSGMRVEVPASFKQLEDGTIGFEIGVYDPGLPLVIDPVLVYSTYLGGSTADNCNGILVDADGNAFLVGDSSSSNFLRNASPGNSDVFVGKLSPDGLILTYSFFGGSKNDTATGLAVDGSGNIYLSGSTESADFPRINSVGTSLLGSSDAFVVKLNPTADVFIYSSLVGGSGEEVGVSLAAAGDSAFITGRTTSEDFPTLGAIQPVYGGGTSDAFIAKLSPDGKSLLYSSFLGGSGTENLIAKTGISIDGLGNACVVGDTDSVNFPTRDAIRPTKTGDASNLDGFVAKLNPAGSDFVYSTYLGGSNSDFALAVASDPEGNAYVTGGTNSTSFTGSSSTRPSTGTRDAFVAKLNPPGSAISYLTFVGGDDGEDRANAIAVDSLGNAVIAGRAGEQFPTLNSVQSFFKGGEFENDAFAAKLGPSGAVTFSTYLGGSLDDTALGVAIDADGAVYFAGFTSSTDFLTATPLLRDNAGGPDIFIAKIDPDSNPNRPVLLQALISGKHLILYGQGFDAGAKLRINDLQVKTRNEDPDPTQILFAKKAAKRIAKGATAQLQVQNANGKRSNFLFFTRPE
jgi:hypothetical protein